MKQETPTSKMLCILSGGSSLISIIPINIIRADSDSNMNNIITDNETDIPLLNELENGEVFTDKSVYTDTININNIEL